MINLVYSLIQVSNGSTVARNRRKGEKFTDGSQLLASLKTNGEGYKSIEDSMSTSDATKSRRQQSEEKHMDKGNSTRRVRSSSPGSGSPTAKRGPAAKKGYDLSNRDKRNGQEKVSRRGGQSSESDNENSRKRKRCGLFG